MKKYGDKRDVDRRRNYVATLQDGQEWIQRRRLPPANAVWPTCLIIAPASVVQNWEREFQTVCVSPSVILANTFADVQATVGLFRDRFVHRTTEPERGSLDRFHHGKTGRRCVDMYTFVLIRAAEHK